MIADSGGASGVGLWRMTVRLSKGGLIASGIYIVIFAALNGLAHYATTVKGAAVLEQISIIPAGTVFDPVMKLLGVPDFPPLDSIFNSLYFYGLISLVVVYLFGWVVTAIGRLLLGPEDERFRGIDQRLVDRLDRDRK